MKWRSLMWIMWPSFLVAAMMTFFVFAFIDPLDLVIFGHIETSRMQAYTIGFFFFWVMAALSSTLTLKIAPRPREYDEFGDPL
ncbi:hypothetical protein VRY85_09250 [Achromobacter sp. F4_2707]|uniref:hypothetical protein n=1 Tax=Achromobacter sp. F4_2707 TaxID=3114286 RepID=UPI0039C63A36